MGASFRSFGMLLPPMHAATDIGSAVDWLQSQVVLSSDENGCLAVLHNRNKMVAPLATQNGSSNQRVRFSPRALHGRTTLERPFFPSFPTLKMDPS